MRRRQKKNGKWAPAPKDAGIQRQRAHGSLPGRKRCVDYDVPRASYHFKEFPTSLCKSSLRNFYLEKLLVYFHLKYFSHTEENKAIHFPCKIPSNLVFTVSGCQVLFIIMKVLSGREIHTQPLINSRGRGQEEVK